ncbi:hypothetical protein ScPMuIL_015143 [Solemya velum]
MGQNNSKVSLPSPIEVERRPPPRPDAPPSSRAISELGPKGPSYCNPENKVLPMLETDTPLKRLRPVSLELSKYRPEFIDLFHHDDGENQNDLNKNSNKESDSNKENVNSDTSINVHDENKPQNILTNKNFQNGHIPKEEPRSILKHTERDALAVSPRLPSYNNKAPARYAGHRRHLSASASLITADNIIHEDPEEYFDQPRGKIDPLMLSYPLTSLPQKSTFDMDYSYNLTYAQLAESRRNKTISELERKTGLSLNSLSADLAENVDIPIFFKGTSQASTRSTTSAEIGVSRKKRRAPQPPGKSNDYSIENEPPVDYEMDDSPKHIVHNASLHQSMETNTPTIGRHAPPVVPPPPHPSLRKSYSDQQYLIPRKAVGEGLPKLLRQSSVHSEPRTPQPEPEHLPWLLEIKNAATKRTARRQLSETGDLVLPPANKDDSPELDQDKKSDIIQNTDEPTLIFSASDFPKTSPATPQKLTPATSPNPKSVNGMDDSISTHTDSSEKSEMSRSTDELQGAKQMLPRQNSSPAVSTLASELLHRQNSITSSRSATSEPSPSKASTPTCPIRRLNSLLQYDIKIAAQAKATKLVKHTTPVKPKPKEPHKVFQEQLAKACADREERMKDTSVDEQLKEQNNEKKQDDDIENSKHDRNNNDGEESVQKKNKDMKIENDSHEKMSLSDRKTSSASSSSLSSRASSDVFMKKMEPVSPMLRVKDTKERLYIQNGDVKSSTKVSRNEDHSYSKDWIPEDDLGSDDDLSDREAVTTRKGESEGFKSSIIPNRVGDLKNKGKDKKVSRKQSDSSDERAKYGSIKKFKKSVHKSMKNAFGSLSRASGKLLLKKFRSEDLEQVDDVPKNWKFQAEPIVNGHVSERAQRYIMDPQTFDLSDEESDDDMEPKVVETEKKVLFEGNGEMENDDDNDGDEKHYQFMKRAGVAYISGKGQIVVLPEFKTVKVDDEGHLVGKEEGRAPQIVQKKKKFAYAATLRRKEQAEREEQLAQEVELKEQRREEEKQKMIQAEREMQNLRDIETQQRLQRLEAAHLQQRINHHHTQSNLAAVSAPSLPPSESLPANFAAFPNYSGQRGYVPLWNPGLSGLPQNSVPNSMAMGLGGVGGYSAPPLLNPVTNVPYDLSDYMRMLGMQPVPSSNSQQFAYLLNSMNYNSPVYSMLSPEQKKYFLGQNGTAGFVGSAAANSNYPLMSGIKVDPRTNQFPIHSSGELGNVSTLQRGPNTLELNEFVSHNNNHGANEKQMKGDLQKKKEARNPLYFSSDESDDEGLSQTKNEQSGTASINVKDFRQSPSPRQLSSDGSQKQVSSPVGSPKNLTSNGILPYKNGTSMSDAIANRMEYLKERMDKS